jgi:DNA-binding PadR family transcriptional regulator
MPGSAPEAPQQRRYVLTQQGRDLLARWRAEEFLFGRCITLVEAVA